MINEIAIKPFTDLAPKVLTPIVSAITNKSTDVVSEKSLDELKSSFNNAKSTILSDLGKSLPSVSKVAEDIDQLSTKSLSLASEKVKESFSSLLQLIPANQNI